MLNKHEHDSDQCNTLGNVWSQPNSDYFKESASMKKESPILEKPISSGDPRESQNSRLPSENRQSKQVRKKGNLLLWLPLGGMLLVVLALLWCLAFHFLGNRAYSSGEYEKAASLFRKDFLLSQAMLWNAEYISATEKFNQGQFEQAAEIYSKLGDEAHEDWLNAVTAESERIQRESSAEAGLEYLGPYAGEERIDRTISRLQMQMAKEHLEKGQYTEAVSIASGIVYQDEVNLDTFYEKAYYLMGTEALSQKNYAQAADYLLRCKDTSARTHGTILKNMQEGAYYEAAQSIMALKASAQDSDLTDALNAILTSRINEKEGKSLEIRLNQEAAQKVLWNGQDADAFSAEWFSDDEDLFFFEGGEYIGEIQEELNLIPVTSLDAILQKTAITPAGKVLILREQYGYPKAEPYYAVDLGTMSSLPASVYPASLAEVEYLITLFYDYAQTNRGTLVTSFSDGSKTQRPVVVLRLKGQVRVEALPSNQELYHSPVVQGGASPSALGGGTDWKCGDPPRIGKYIYTAITKVMP